MRREGLLDKDASFKAMVDLEDEVSHLNNSFDFDNKGKFMKGQDGYALGESVDFHDLDGNLNSTNAPVPRIIGKTNPKTEIYNEGHPERKLTIAEKIQK